MKKSILTVAILALSSASFAGDYVDLPGGPVLPTNSVDCGGASTCMPDQTLNQGDNTSTKTAQQDLNGNAVTISPVLTDENVNKNNITGGNTTSTGGTNTATGGTYTTGALNAGGATVGNTDNASSATTGASSSSIGNTSTGGNSLVGGTQTAQTGASTSSTGAVTVNPINTTSASNSDTSTRNTASKATGGSVGNTSTGASTSSTGAVTVNPNNTNGQSLADSSTRNTSSKASGGSVGNTSTGASTSSTGAVTVNPTNTQGLTDASTRNTQQQQSLTGGATTVTPTSNQNASANNSAKTGSNTSTTNVDAADRSSTVYQSLAYALPDMPAVVATNLATAQMTKTVGVCGPLVNIRRDKVTGVYQGLMFKTRIDQGHDDNVEAFIDNDGNEQLFKVVNVAGRQMLSGHQLHITSAVISLGGARQLGLGGGSVSGDYGQGSAGSSSQTQRLITNVQAVPCVLGVLEAAPVNRIKG